MSPLLSCSPGLSCRTGSAASARPWTRTVSTCPTRRAIGSLLGQLREDGREHAQVTESAQRRQAQLLGPVLTRLGAYEQWALREKAVHATMNLLNTGISNRTVLAEAWIPTDQTPRVQAALQRACARAGAETPSVLHELKPYSTPPTLIRTNKLTETFQVSPAPAQLTSGL